MLSQHLQNKHIMFTLLNSQDALKHPNIRPLQMKWNLILNIDEMLA